MRVFPTLTGQLGFEKDQVSVASELEDLFSNVHITNVHFTFSALTNVLILLLYIHCYLQRSKVIV